MKSIFNSRSPLMQMITTFIAIVILASLTIGVPVIWLMHNQLDHQAWAQVEQGQRMTIALYASHYKRTLNLAVLAAQRPTLQELLVQNDIPALTDYLITLRSGAGLDRIVICNPEEQLVATTDNNIPASVCKTWKTGNYQHNRAIPQVCLTAHQSIENETGYLGDVFVCSRMDDNFETHFRDQTGLEHILWIEDILVSTSFLGEVSALESIPSNTLSMNGHTSQRFFEINGVSYYAARIPLDANGLQAEVALDVTEYVAARTRLVAILIVSILGISFLGSILGVLLVRRHLFSEDHSRPV